MKYYAICHVCRHVNRRSQFSGSEVALISCLRIQSCKQYAVMYSMVFGYGFSVFKLMKMYYTTSKIYSNILLYLFCTFSILL